MLAGASLLALSVAAKAAFSSFSVNGSGSIVSNGYPDLTNTGVPSGTSLTASGSITASTPGQVISGMNVTGTVYVTAPGVTIMDNQINFSSYAGVQISPGITGTVVKYNSINGNGATNANDPTGIIGSGTFIGNNIYGVENGISTDTSSSQLGCDIENNYIHNLIAVGSPHYDPIQIDGNTSGCLVQHNTLINVNSSASGGVMMDNASGSLANITVTNNLIEGGGFSIYDDGHFNANAITGISITNNHLGGAAYGDTDFNGTTPTYTGNVDDAATLLSGMTLGTE